MDDISPGVVETLNGVPIYFEIRGSGQPLLLLHGFSGSSADWRTLPASLSESFRLIVPDLRGHGRSGLLSQPFRHRDAADDVLALLDHLRIETCSGLGISGGGNVLLHMATKEPARLKAMVLVSATPTSPRKPDPSCAITPNTSLKINGNICALVTSAAMRRSSPSWLPPTHSPRVMTI